jgi:hypothetical protein
VSVFVFICKTKKVCFMSSFHQVHPFSGKQLFGFFFLVFDVTLQSKLCSLFVGCSYHALSYGGQIIHQWVMKASQTFDLSSGDEKGENVSISAWKAIFFNFRTLKFYKLLSNLHI